MDRAINSNQLLILSNVDGKNITALLTMLSEKFSVPLSTLKLNAKVLKEIGLISFEKSSGLSSVSLTDLGKFVKEILAKNQGFKTNSRN